MSKYLYFVILDDNKPSFKPLKTELKDTTDDELKAAIHKLLDECDKIRYESYDGEVKRAYGEDTDMIRKDIIGEVIYDLKQIQHYVCRYDKYMCIAFSIDQYPCVVSSKGAYGYLDKRIYKWTV